MLGDDSIFFVPRETERDLNVIHSKKEGDFADPYLYDIILNVVELEFKTKPLKVTRSVHTLQRDLRAIEECVQTDEFFANQEQVLSADPIFHQAIEITKQNLRVSSMKKTYSN